MAGPRQWKKQIAGFTVLGLVLVCLTTSLFFIVALSPCRLRLQPGQVIAYELITRRQPVDATGVAIGAPDQWREEVHLLCIAEDNEAALVTPGGPGRSDEVTLLRFDDNGGARRVDPARRPLPSGKAIGPFDFNLLPLPEGLDQSWRAPVIYAVPPPGKQEVVARVRRIANGIRPRFELRLPNIEWLDDRRSDRYVQIRDLVCRYTYDSSRSIVDEADMQLTLGLETTSDEPQYHRYTIELRAQVVEEGEADAPATVALRDLALATSRLQHARRSGELPERVRELAEQVRRDLARQQGDGPMVELARSLAATAGEAADPVRQGFDVQVASVGISRRAAADELVAELQADEFPARLIEQRGRLLVRIGPYRQRSDAVLAELRRRFPREQPIWVRSSRVP